MKTNPRHLFYSLFLPAMLAVIPAQASDPLDQLQCVTERVTDAVACGVTPRQDGKLCGYEKVRDAAVCGYEVVKSGSLCGWKQVQSIAECGWKWSEKGFKKAKKCKVAKKCKQPKRCKVARTCETANTCIVERCEQHQPGGLCIPGVTECTAKGFTCEAQLMMCLPRYSEDILLNPTACAGAYDAKLAQAAVDAGKTMSYSVGAGIGLGTASSEEYGVVYGEGGQYACFSSECFGFDSSLGVGSFASFGLYDRWGVFAGRAMVYSGSADVGSTPASFSLGAVTDTASQPIGGVGSISTSLPPLDVPVSAAVMECDTFLDQGGPDLLDEILVD